MDKFGHFFELFAALNSAYIVSNHFIQSLILKINNHFSTIQKEITLIVSLQKNNLNRLIVEGDKCSNIVPAQQVVIKLNKQQEDLQSKIESLSREIDQSIKENSISENFNYLCLFGALYCILILILNGFGFDFKTAYNRESFLLFNIFSVIQLIWYFRDKKSRWFKKFKASYNRVLFVFPISFILAFPLLLWLQNMFSWFECEYDFTWVNQAVSILIPTAHFIYYSIKSSTKTKKQSKSLKQKSENIKKECEDFAKTIQTAFDTVNAMVRRSTS